MNKYNERQVQHSFDRKHTGIIRLSSIVFKGKGYLPEIQNEEQPAWEPTCLNMQWTEHPQDTRALNLRSELE